MKKFNPNKNIFILLILAIIAVALISITAASRAKEKNTNLVQSAINDTVSVVDRVVSAPSRLLKHSSQSLTALFNTYDENEALKRKLDKYEALTLQNKNQQKEIEQLKEELQLKQTLTSYEEVTANVITRSPDTWQNILIVDKGSSDGIKSNMAVMAQKGLIGRVIEVNAHSAKIELLTTNNKDTDQFPIRITSKDGESFGLLSKYDGKSQLLVASKITENKDIKAGDVVQTSGLGGNSPANLPIGTISKIEPASYGLDREVYIKPYAQMYDLSVVTIVKRMVEASE
ncbi:rod shape-determining protein MreC [Enterococcus sp. CSURQ0835]|uniref:rod shape-determining protein MreC n=1 Tax=Enterococcus sp. CSURQ0835 TaxID=2681394 RepID=UPI0013575ED0|nr:rod shape-determining protein MreC [Enterococcus sp. CSURQ0835]